MFLFYLYGNQEKRYESGRVPIIGSCCFKRHFFHFILNKQNSVEQNRAVCIKFCFY
jgi:hypothetical protein